MPKTAPRKASGKKTRSSGAKQGSSSRQKQAAGSRTTQRARARSHQNWAFVLFFCGLLLLLSLFGGDATVVAFLGKTARYTIGTGFWVMPFGCFFAGILLLRSRGRRVAGRVCSVLLFPFLFGALLHALFGSAEYAFTREGFQAMLAAADAHRGGGILAGYLTALSITHLSRFATIVLFLTLSVAALLCAADVTLMTIIEKTRALLAKIQWRAEDEEEGQYYEEEDEIPEMPALRLPKRRRPIIDIPLDAEVIADEPVSADRAEDTVIPVQEMVLEPPAVKTPAEVFAGEELEGSVPALEETFHVNADNFTDEPPLDLSPETEQEEKIAPQEAEGFVVPTQTEHTQGALYHYPPLSLLKAPKRAVKGDSLETLRALGLKSTLR